MVNQKSARVHGGSFLREELAGAPAFPFVSKPSWALKTERQVPWPGSGKNKWIDLSQCISRRFIVDHFLTYVPGLWDHKEKRKENYSFSLLLHCTLLLEGEPGSWWGCGRSCSHSDWRVTSCQETREQATTELSQTGHPEAWVIQEKLIPKTATL